MRSSPAAVPEIRRWPGTGRRPRSGRWQASLGPVLSPPRSSLMSVSVRRRLRRLAPVALGALAFGALSIPAARASIPGPTPCDDSPLSQPFLAFGDARSYELAPGGDFEGALGDWSLDGSAGVVAGN